MDIHWICFLTTFFIFGASSLDFKRYTQLSRQKEIKNFQDKIHVHLISNETKNKNFEIKTCKTSNGPNLCVDIGTCQRKNIEYNDNKNKITKCTRPNGRPGECCPKNRNKRDLKRAQVLIFEDTKEPTKEVDLSKLGDISSCGYSSKVYNGKKPLKSDITQHPWLAALIIKKISLQYCGGALIDRRHILTAAHCVPEGVVPEGIIIRLGEYDFSRENDSKSINATVEAIKYHEDYDPATYENDIALIKLKDNVQYNEYISPVCLPVPEDPYYKENITVIAAGWGKTVYKGNMSNVLKEVSIPLWDQKKCVYSFAQTVHKSAMCAAGYQGGLDSCQGDSGGPLVTQKDNNKWTTVGIVSWGVKCGNKGKPGVYTRVNEYLEWIAENL